MTPEQLVSAVRARLDEMERVALAVSTGPHKPERWTAARYKHDPRGWRVDGQFSCVVDSAFGPDAEHIILHDPAAVLRRVAADRRVLERHKPVDARVVGYPTMERGICAYCTGASEHFSGDFSPLGWEIEDDNQAVKWPCADFRDLADRLGIDPEEAG